MPFTTIGELRFYIEEVGEGIPVLMIHGFSPDHRLMKGCMEPIFNQKIGYRRIYFDLPGMGKTENYQKISSSDDILEAVLNLIEHHIPNEPFLIVGESFGGYLARGVIEKLNHRILGAAFICPLIKPNHKERELPPHEVIEADYEFLDSLNSEEREDFYNNNVVLNASVWERYQKEIVAGVKLANIPFLNKLQKQYPLKTLIDTRPFRMPSIFILGKQDSVVGFKDAMKLDDIYTHASFAILDKAGHNLQIEQPYLFSCLIEEWLTRTSRI
ncbi:alpha/beta fold hydrolase [Psychrobacillus antarcticus]|uniref:alpha/beta fold hydrolase n=1 Tax=Psychrobacillus antarcticus TaxID=2879115 RepID=UPI002407FE0F|nr:alpha/beta hydrolase [Psychrobacillus antarcticus]